MTVLVALLRGINVGGRSSLTMAELGSIAEGCGLREVSTYVQSGNLVFAAGHHLGAAEVEQRLHDAIAVASGFAPQVVVRTAGELSDTVTAGPFAARPAARTHVHVGFVSLAEPPPDLSGLELSAYAPEEAVVVGHDLHLHLPSGMGRSPLASAVARLDGTPMTLRNWQTVSTLADMARRLDARLRP